MTVQFSIPSTGCGIICAGGHTAFLCCPTRALLCAGKEVDSIDYWAGEVRRLECEIVAARNRALASPPCASYFVFFSSQKDAAIAAQTNIHPEDGRSFRVIEAPGPEEVPRAPLRDPQETACEEQATTYSDAWTLAHHSQDSTLRVPGHNAFCRLWSTGRCASSRSCTGRSLRHRLTAAQMQHARSVKYLRNMQVNWPTLWMSWRERELREILVLPIIVLIMLVPVGAFSGAPAHLLISLTCTSL